MGNKTHIHPNPTLVIFTINFLLTLLHSFIHDLMRSRGLPVGIFPKTTKLYHLNIDFLLEVHMEEPCLAKFGSSVFFDSMVRANLSYGGLITIQGSSQEDLFLWLPVKNINIYDPSSGLIVFDIGLASKKFALSAFEEPRFCVPIGHNLMKEVGRDEMKLSSEQ